MKTGISYRIENFFVQVCCLFVFVLIAWFLGTVGVRVVPFRPEFVNESTARAISGAFVIIAIPTLVIAWLEHRGLMDRKAWSWTMLALTLPSAAFLFLFFRSAGARFDGFASIAFGGLLLMGVACTFSLEYIEVSRGLAVPLRKILRYF
jgi:hypothetical protein